MHPNEILKELFAIRALAEKVFDDAREELYKHEQHLVGLVEALETKIIDEEERRVNDTQREKDEIEARALKESLKEAV